MDYKESKDLKGTKTADNLMRAFLNESHAALRYEYYSKQAKKDGYVQIQNIFKETADNEKTHAKEFYKYLNAQLMDEEMVVDIIPVPVMLEDTLSNLKTSLAGERAEMTDIYPEFSKIAEEEGFPKVAKTFKYVGKVEEAHANRFEKLIYNIENDKVFKKDEVVRWKCNNCGYVTEGIEAPEECPACKHPVDHFELFRETY